MAKVWGVLVVALVAWGSAAQADEQGRWQTLGNNPSCVVWNAEPQPSETVTWSGACANDKAQGRGTEVWRYLEDGEWKEDKYTGEMKDGKKHGRGVYVWGRDSKWAGDRYEGDWKDGKVWGRGVYVWANGDRYEGEFRDDKRHGRGVFRFASGDECEGEWRGVSLLGTGKGRRGGRWMKCHTDGKTINFTD